MITNRIIIAYTLKASPCDVGKSWIYLYGIRIVCVCRIPRQFEFDAYLWSIYKLMKILDTPYEQFMQKHRRKKNGKQTFFQSTAHSFAYTWDKYFERKLSKTWQKLRFFFNFQSTIHILFCSGQTTQRFSPKCSQFLMIGFGMYLEK